MPDRWCLTRRRSPWSRQLCFHQMIITSLTLSFKLHSHSAVTEIKYCIKNISSSVYTFNLRSWNSFIWANPWISTLWFESAAPGISTCVVSVHHGDSKDFTFDIANISRVVPPLNQRFEVIINWPCWMTLMVQAPDDFSLKSELLDHSSQTGGWGHLVRPMDDLGPRRQCSEKKTTQ